MGEPIRILVSACLLGAKVRYDGGHKRDDFLVDTLGRFVEWVPVCPEADSGLPVPREAMHLVRAPGGPRLVGVRSGTDFTEGLLRWTQARLSELEGEDLCGYICKKDSPSSGMERVRVYGEAGVPVRTGAGLFTAAFRERFPLVPVEEEGRLRDPALREMFIEKVFTLRRYREMLAGGRTRGRLVEFHTDHKMLLLSHDRRIYDEMGRLVAGAGELRPAELFVKYRERLMAALSVRPTPGKRADVLTHMAGHLRPFLSADERTELREAVDAYRRQEAPLLVPVTLLRHHVRKFRVAYLARQVFLDPHPAELMLRNHA